MTLLPDEENGAFIKTIVTFNFSHKRLDQFLSETETTASRSKIQRWIRDGIVSVNSVVIKKCGHKVMEGDIITVKVPNVPSTTLKPENIPLDIVYEDEALLVFNKTCGLVVLPAVGHTSATLVNALLYHCQDFADFENSIRPGIVHRLDKATSGLLSVAKTEDTRAFLSKQLAERQIKRRYNALVWGCPKNLTGVIDTSIGRHPKYRQRMAVVETDAGRRSITHYRVLKPFNQGALLELDLETGRTHQIRVHLSHIGNPIIGDPVYGGRVKWLARLAPKQRPRLRKMLEFLKRQALHATELEFLHPYSKQYHKIKVPLPDDIQEAISLLSRPN